MIKSLKSSSTSYLCLDRKQWSSLYNTRSLTLTEKELSICRNINQSLSLNEIEEVYLPLLHLLNYCIRFGIYHHVVPNQFFYAERKRLPYIVGITGSVSAGKSTMARVLQTLLSRWPEHRSVELVTTDGFLFPNWLLQKRNLIRRKGFLESYDICSLVTFILNLRAGVPNLTVPTYSHIVYDILPTEQQTITQPDVLILEGLNILQDISNYSKNYCGTFIPDFVDFSIYIDAPETLLRAWYVDRFLKLRQGSFFTPNSYFHIYSKLSEKEIIAVANRIWIETNGPNLRQNILPTRNRATIILKKNANHEVETVQISKWRLIDDISLTFF